MPMLAGELGVRMMLLAGATVPVPAPLLARALLRAEITSDEKGGDGFQLTFQLAKDGPLEFGLLKSGAVDPMTRIAIGLTIGATPVALMNGVITHHQVAPGPDPSQSTLTVTGEDLSLLADLDEVNRDYRNMSDSAIVHQVLMQHAQHGILPPHRIAPTTQVRSELEGTVRQHETDLAFLKRLAARNGFVFYLEPTVFGASRAYWGPPVRAGVPQRALTIGMGSWTNVTSLSFADDLRTPVEASGHYLDPATKASMPIPHLPPAGIPLSAKPSTPKRRVLIRDAAGRNPGDAATRRVAAAAEPGDPVTGTGELSTVRYGDVLRTRQLVGVRGAGFSYDGFYYVRRVTHVLAKEAYTQRFTIGRDGRGATLPVVLP